MFLNKWKHIFLLFLLTGIALFVTKSFWYFPSNGIEVSFTSQAEKPIAYQVFYTTSDKRSFNRDEKVTRNVKAGKHRVKIMLPVEKILCFRLDLGQFPQKITISDLKVSGKTAVLMDKLSDFSFHQIDSSKQDGKFFQLISNQPDPYIIYKTPVNIEAKWQVKVDYYILFIIAVISLLAAHKIVKYLAQFKFKENSSRIDIVFVTIFFVLLFVPMLKISGADKSEKENRMLAKYVPFIKNGQINLKYSTNFESWYNDRFLGRDFLINIWSFLEHTINPSRGNKRGLIGKDGWLFTTLYNAVEMYRHANLFTDAELRTIGTNLTRFVEKAKKQGVKEVYFYLSNDKESLYGEYYPDWIVQLDQPSRLEQLYGFIKENYPEIQMFNFAQQLQAVKTRGEVLFLKPDTHMTAMGAFYEYTFLMEEIKKDFPNIQLMSLKDFDIKINYSGQKDIYTGINLSDSSYSKENFKNKMLYLKKTSQTHIERKRLSEFHIHTDTTNPIAKNHYTLVAINDSFLEQGRLFYQESFAHMVMHLFISGKKFQIAPEGCLVWRQTKPDILLIATTERFLDRFLTLQYPCTKK